MSIFATYLGIQTFGAPRDIIDTTEGIYVEKVEVTGWVEEEGDGAGDDFPEILDPHEEYAVDSKWEDIEEHSRQDEIPQHINKDASTR